MPLNTKPNAAPSAPAEAKAKSTVTSSEAAKAAAAAAAPIMTDEQKAILGSKSANIKFLNPLGNPAWDDVTVLADGNKKTTPFIVGFRFEILNEDVEIPDVGTTPAMRKNNLMDHNPERINNTRLVKAGSIVDLTLFETAMLLSRPEYNAQALAGDHPVTVSYAVKGVKGRDGSTVAAVADAQMIPRISLRPHNGSLKDCQFIEVLSVKKTPGENGVTITEKKINAGFEKWAPLAAVSVRTPRSVSEKDSTTVANRGAQAFLQVVQARAKRSQ